MARRRAGRTYVVGAVLAGLVLANGFVPAGAASGYAAQLRRYPYLTDLVARSVGVNWATDTSTTSGSAAWGRVDGAGNCTPNTAAGAARTTITVNGVSEYQWKSVLPLPSLGAYCYRVLLGGTDLLGSDPSPRFTTQVPAGSTAPYSFAVFGDWGQTDANGNNPDTANLMGQIGASGVRFAVGLGDNGYPSGSQTNAGDLRQTGANVSALFGPSSWAGPGRSIPLFATAGNHGASSGTATRSTDEINFPQDVAVATSGGRYIRETYCCVNGTSSASYPSAWYAFDAGNARFYVLNASWADVNLGDGTAYSDDYAAHWTPSSPEYQWLQDDLTSHSSALKFAFFHYPLYSDQKAQTSDTYLQGPNSLEGLLASHGVDLGFSGHAHLYQRNVATGPGTFPTYVSGGGGGTLQPIAEVGCSANDAYGIGWSPTKLKGSKCGAAPVPDAATRVFHFLKVTVNGTTVTVSPTDELGRTFDVVTYDFSNQIPDTQIDSEPPASTNSTSASFAFHASVSGATFNCRLDGGGFAPCVSPRSYSGLADGAHTFAVQAVTEAGSDPSPDTAAWTVDTTPPSSPAGLTATAPLPSLVNLTWSPASDANGVSQYQIVRGGAVIGSSAETTFADPGVTPNTTYSYQVIAVDGAGNQSLPSNVATVTTPGASSAVFSDGFESGSFSAWTSSAGLTVETAVTHAGTSAAQANTANGNTYAKKTLGSTYTDAYSRIWFNALSAASQVNLLRYRTATDASIGYVFLTAGGSLGVRNDIAGTTTISSTSVSMGGGWHSLELHMVVNGPSSTIEVWLDGAIVGDLSTTTANLGATPVGRFQIGEVQSARTYNVVYDDAAFATQRIGP